MSQVRNELTSAEFALNIDAPRPRVNGRSASNTGADWAGNGDGDGRDDRGDSGVSENTTGGVSSAIDFDSIAERLEANLRTLQAGRPLSFLEAIPEDEVSETTEGDRGAWGVMILDVIGVSECAMNAS